MSSRPAPSGKSRGYMLRAHRALRGRARTRAGVTALYTATKALGADQQPAAPPSRLRGRVATLARHAHEERRGSRERTTSSPTPNPATPCCPGRAGGDVTARRCAKSSSTRHGIPRVFGAQDPPSCADAEGRRTVWSAPTVVLALRTVAEPAALGKALLGQGTSWLDEDAPAGGRGPLEPPEGRTAPGAAPGPRRSPCGPIGPSGSRR